MTASVIIARDMRLGDRIAKRAEVVRCSRATMRAARGAVEVGLWMLVLLTAACAPAPQRATIPTQWLPSPNHDARRPSFIVLHHTGADTAEHSLKTLTDPQREVSAHYLIGRSGLVWQLVDERARAWHAGESYWAGVTDLNSVSIGIELDNNGDEPFAEPQIAMLLSLLHDLTARYRIPAS